MARASRWAGSEAVAPAGDPERFQPAGPRAQEAALFALLALLLLLRHAPAVFSPLPLIDEEYYLRAFAAVREGLSPYSVDGFFYPPGFAALGGWLAGWLPERGLLYGLRGLNLAALLWLVAASSRGAGFGWCGRALLAAAAILLAPGIALGVLAGNISFTAAAAILAAGLHWRRHPWIAGPLLGASLAIKPMATGAIAVLGAFRSRERNPRLRLLAGAGLAALATTLPFRSLLADYLQLGATLPGERYPLTRTIGVHRLLVNLGWETERIWALLLVLAIALLAGQWRARSDRQILFAALATTTLTIPVLWSHALAVTLPLQMAAAGRCLGAGRTRIPRLHRIAILALVLALQFTDGIGGLAPGPSLLLALALLPLLAAPVVLAVWLGRQEESAALSGGAMAAPGAGG